MGRGGLMPLQPNAQRRVEEKIQELFGAFDSGARWATQTNRDESTNLMWRGFRAWLEQAYPDLYEYCPEVMLSAGRTKS